jgi:hypothetical protein
LQTTFAFRRFVCKGKEKVALCPELPVAHKRPPCDPMIERLVARPMPVPPTV